jgi:esterase/lipase superfamily enzyme
VARRPVKPAGAAPRARSDSFDDLRRLAARPNRGNSDNGRQIIQVSSDPFDDLMGTMVGGLAPLPVSAGSAAGKQAVEELEDGRRLVKLWFGTNREEVPGGSMASRFSGRRSRQPNPLTLGEAVVSMPPVHKEARVERPSVFRLEFSEDPARHMIVTGVKTLGEDEWAGAARGHGDEGLLFIHGYNVSFEEAVLRTAQIAFDLKFPGVPLLFSWASRGELKGYFADTESAEWSVPHLVEFLTLARSTLGLQRLHVIAHSMGSRILMRALEKVNAQAEPGHTPISQVVLAAADIGVDVFSQLKSCFMVGEQVTAYVSRADRALTASRHLHASSRLGDADPPAVLDNVVTIDATSVGADMFGLGHGYVAGTRGVFADLFYLIRHRLRPDERKSIRREAAGHYVLQ